MNKIKEIYQLLFKEFGPQGWWPIGNKYDPSFKERVKGSSERFEICVGAILTQSTSWKNVELALNELRKSNALSVEKIKKINEKELAKLIKSAGYNNQKAKKLKCFVDYRGEVTRSGLLSIWGVGNETADSILLYAYNEPVFVIDAYTKRIFSRIGLCNKDDPYEVLQEMFHSSLKKDYKLFNEYHALIVELAKRNCKIKPDCSNCVLNKICQKKI